MHQLRQSLIKIVNNILSKENQKMIDLFLHWSEIMGAFLDQHIQPLRWVQDHKTYKIWLTVSRSGAMDIQYHMPVIHERLSQYLGHDQKIKIVLEPKSYTPLKDYAPHLTHNPQIFKSIQDIKHPALRRAYEHWYATLTHTKNS